MTTRRAALLDQLRAAENESAALLDRLSWTMRRHYTATGGRWARAVMEDRRARLAAGDPTLTVCPHLTAPVAVVLPAWAPVVTCHRCAADLVPLPTVEEDRTCDGCREVVPTLRPVVVGAPPVTVTGALCPVCWAAEGAAES